MNWAQLCELTIPALKDWGRVSTFFRDRRGRRKKGKMKTVEHTNFLNRLICLYECLACMYVYQMCVWCLFGSIQDVELGYRWLWAAMCTVGTEEGSPLRHSPYTKLKLDLYCVCVWGGHMKVRTTCWNKFSPTVIGCLITLSQLAVLEQIKLGNN